MAHLAIQEADVAGTPVTWGAHVTDEEYGGRRRAPESGVDDRLGGLTVPSV